MNICKTAGIVFLIVYSLIYLRLLIKTEKPIKQFFINAFISAWCFAVINLTAFLTTVYLPVNLYTLLTAVFGGLPYTALMIILRSFIF